MDIFLHILLIVIIGGFFFLDKFSTSFNPMFFVVILAIVGFVLIQTSDIEYINYNSIEKVNNSYYQNPSINLNEVSIGIFSVQSFFVLIYWFILILGAVNIFIGKKEGNKRE